MLHLFNQSSETAIAMAVRPEERENKRVNTDTVAMPIPPQLPHIASCHQRAPFRESPHSRKLSKIQNKTNTNTKTKTMANTFREYHQRAILETCDL